MEFDSALLDPSALNWSCHRQLVKLANIQEGRVLALLEEERKSKSIILKLNTLIKNYVDLLCRIQELEFDLGLVAYQRGTPKEAIAAAARSEQLRHKQVFEAIAAVQHIFREEGIEEEKPLNIDKEVFTDRKEKHAQI